jgi:hypothetical protein
LIRPTSDWPTQTTRSLVRPPPEMSLARTVPRVYNFSARLAQAQLSSRQATLVYRTFASSSARPQATPVEDQKIVKPVDQQPSKHTAVSDPEDPYRGGPSAIDKAVHLFFFTEIIRGLFDFTRVYFRSVFAENISRVQECGSSSNSSSDLHTPSCIRSRRVLSLRASVANMLCVGTRVGRKGVSVSPNIYREQFIPGSDAPSSLQTLRSYLPCPGYHH